MVIDRDRRIVRTGHPAGRHKRIAAGLHDLRFGAGVAQYLPRKSCHAPHVIGFGRIHTDRWNIDHLTQEIFVSFAILFDVGFELLMHRHVWSSCVVGPFLELHYPLSIIHSPLDHRGCL